MLAPAAGAIDVPGSGGRLSVGGYLDGLAVADTGGGPRQRPQALLDLHLDGVATRWLRGRLDVRERIGGPFEGGSGIGVYDFDHTYQNVSPSTEVVEAWAEARSRHAELRVGVQKFAWGKLDGIPPTDVLNPRDYHDPIVEDFEERKIGVPAAAGTWYLPDVAALGLTELRATLVWVPIAVPPRLALLQERWFPSSIVPPTEFVLSRATFANAGLPGVGPITLPVKIETQNHRPPRRLEDGAVAFRLGGTWGASDWDVYHYTGPETNPDLDLRPELFLELGPNVRGSITSRLRQASDAFHMTGADWAAPVGPFTLRAEVAVFQDRAYLRRTSDLISAQALANLPLRRILRELQRPGHRAEVPLGDLFPTLDSIEWGAGADTVWHGFQPLLQLNQIAFPGDAPPLVLSDPETRLVASIRKRLFEERIELEARGVWAFERQAWYVFPRVGYRIRDDLRVRVGYLAIGGPRLSLIGQFRDNDEVVFDARWTF